MTPTGGADAQGTRVDHDNAPEVPAQRKAGQDRSERGNLANWQKMKGILKEIVESLTGVQEIA